MTAALALPRRPPPDPRLLQRCLLLAVLLHVWLVLVFGNATGTAAPGQGVWGSLTVKLLGRSGADADTPPGEVTRSRPRNGQPRPGGEARETPSANAARPATATDAESKLPPATGTLELPEGFKPVERLPAAPLDTSRVATPSPAPAAFPTLPGAVSRLEATPQSPVAPLPTRPALGAEPQPLVTELPAAPARLENATALTRPESLVRTDDLRSPATASAATAPAVSTAVPTPVQRLEAAPAPEVPARLTRLVPLQPPSAAAESAHGGLEALPSAIRRLEAPAVEPVAVTGVRRSTELRSEAVTASPAAPGGEAALPQAVRRLEAAEGPGVGAPQRAVSRERVMSPSAGPALPQDLPTNLPEAVSLTNAPLAGAAQGEPRAVPAGASARALAGAPEPGTRGSAEQVLPPTAAASAPRPPLNLSLPRGGDIAARRGPGLVDLLPQPPERKSKLEQSIEDAANKDCRKAYAGAGLLAVVPLAVDAARGKGCKW